MTFFEEAAVSLAASVRIIKRDPSAFNDLDTSVEGFFRSFGAILFVAPLAYPQFQAGHLLDVQYCASLGLEAKSLNLTAGYLVLLLSFVLWPVIAALMARTFGLTATYLRYMTAYNWISVPATLISLIPDMLVLAGVTNTEVIFALMLIIFGIMMYLSYYVACEGLGTTPPIAMAFALGDFVVSYGTSYVIGS